MKRMPYRFFLILLLVLTLLLSGCSGPLDRISHWLHNDGTGPSSDEGLVWAKSYDELLKLAGRGGRRLWFDGFRGLALEGAGDAVSNAAKSDSDHSLTNNQVAGVGEADIIQTDGRYLYLVANQRLIIVDAQDPANMRVLTSLKFSAYQETDTRIVSETPLEMYLDRENNRLVLITSGSESEKYPPLPEEEKPDPEEPEPGETEPELTEPGENEGNPGDQDGQEGEGTESDGASPEDPVEDDEALLMDDVRSSVTFPGGPDRYWPPYYSSRQYTTTRVYDISSKDQLKPIQEFSQEGYYVTSRLIDGFLYVVSNRNEYRFYYDVPVNLKAEEVFPSVCGDLTEGDWETVPAERIAILPYGDVSTQVVLAGMDILRQDQKPDVLTVIGPSGHVYASKGYLYMAAYQYEWNFRADRTQETNTDIYRFKLDRGRIREAGQGKVPGYIINQFSMDEHNGYFRIATTTGSAWMDAENPAKNNLYILDGDLKKVGEITGLAKDETIRSVRFRGDEAYMVTFRTVDPLFSLDLSNPRAPKVRGELKIPGYSTYLHPYDEELLIGFGYDVHVQGDNAMNLGVKVSLFDISDFDDPREVSVMIFGGAGSYADILHDHKSLLFSREKNLIAFSATLTPVRATAPWVYEPPVFQGLLVMGIDSNAQLVLRGHVSHTDWEGNPLASANSSHSQGWKETQSYDMIRRSVYSGDILYTFSARKIQSTRLDDLIGIGSLQLPGYDEYPDGIVYFQGGGVRGTDVLD